MYSLRELFKIGNGPSSSHTIGPLIASEEFLKRYKNLDSIKVILYGSLALTGKGHLTDYIIKKTISPLPCTISFDIDTIMKHPNTMCFIGYKDNKEVCRMIVYSVGGGAIEIEGEKISPAKRIYEQTSFRQVADYCKEHNLKLAEYIDSVENDDFDSYMEKIYDTMLQSIENGLNNKDVIPGKLRVKRKAHEILNQSACNSYEDLRKKVMAYAYAASEENSSGGVIVTAPTCGASGVLPACLRYSLELGKYNHKQIIQALKVSGLIGNIVKTNGSISGAEAGCQAEIGTACSMAAAFLAYLHSEDVNMVERASEIALEHHLGLTCDPIEGYVQIPCIERNAVAALRAIDAFQLASYISNSDSKISFDLVVDTMLETGKDLAVNYRETSEGGLAKKYR